MTPDFDVDAVVEVKGYIRENDNSETAVGLVVVIETKKTKTPLICAIATNGHLIPLNKMSEERLSPSIQNARRLLTQAAEEYALNDGCITWEEALAEAKERLFPKTHFLPYATLMRGFAFQA